jgi:hypothetical protein
LTHFLSNVLSSTPSTVHSIIELFVYFRTWTDQINLSLEFFNLIEKLISISPKRREDYHFVLNE